MPRSLTVDDLTSLLRYLVREVSTERTARVGDQAQEQTLRVDVTGWIEWVLVGLEACAIPEGNDRQEQGRQDPWVPSFRAAIGAAKRFAAALAMRRHGGNITHAAKASGTSRRVLRLTLKQTGLYVGRSTRCVSRGNLHGE